MPLGFLIQGKMGFWTCVGGGRGGGWTRFRLLFFRRGYGIRIDLGILYRTLEAHRSCVNALAFSSKEGRFLASGGDGAS